MDEWLVAVIPGLAGAGAVFAIVAAFALRPRRVIRAQRETTLAGIQVRLDRARLGIDAGTYLTRSLAYGALFGLAMAAGTGTWLIFLVGLAAGFVFVWARLEDERNERLNRYHKGLASAADTIVNSWRVKPSINRALEAVASYGQSEVAADFEDVRRAVRGGTPLAAALQEVADRRQSPIFDGLATALIVAEEQSGEVSQVLARQAAATRQMAMIYEETVDEQRGQRADVRVGVFGPWAVMLMLRLATLATGGLGYGTEFFVTPLGQATAVVAAVLTVAAYFHSHRTAGRGLVVERVALERGRGDAAS